MSYLIAGCSASNLFIAGTGVLRHEKSNCRESKDPTQLKGAALRAAGASVPAPPCWARLNQGEQEQIISIPLIGTELTHRLHPVLVEKKICRRFPTQKQGHCPVTLCRPSVPWAVRDPGEVWVNFVKRKGNTNSCDIFRCSVEKLRADLAAAGKELWSVKDYTSENKFSFMPSEVLIWKVLLLCETLAGEIHLTGREFPPIFKGLWACSGLIWRVFLMWYFWQNYFKSLWPRRQFLHLTPLQAAPAPTFLLCRVCLFYWLPGGLLQRLVCLFAPFVLFKPRSPFLWEGKCSQVPKAPSWIFEAIFSSGMVFTAPEPSPELICSQHHSQAIIACPSKAH